VAEVSFSQRDAREYTKWGNTWLRNNLNTLVDFEYILIAKGGRERSKGVYRLKADESIGSLNLSMIPTPEEMGAILKTGHKNESEFK
jgi:hypothetical protein